MNNEYKVKTITTIVGIFLLIYGIGFLVVYNQGAFVMLLLGAVLILWTRVKNTPVTKGIKALIILCYLCLGGLMLFIAIAGGFEEASGDENAVIVLGCKVNENGVSRALRARLDTAVAYYQENPKAKIIVTGGQGGNEPMTEAEAMRRYLENSGVPNESIYKEERATSTNENLKYSKEILKQLFEDDYSACIITNDFHAYRARKLAKLNDMNLTSYNAPTPYISLPVDYCREALAVIKLWLFKY